MTVEEITATALHVGGGHGTPTPTLKPSAFKFDRMFDDLKDRTPAAEAAAKAETLVALGTVMDETPAPGASKDSDIPAGYTYLGQYLAHEISFDGRGQDAITHEEVNLPDPKQCCSPTLDLDSLYGELTAEEKERLYEADGVRMKVGKTTKEDSHWLMEPDQDLPRLREPGKLAPQAQIADPRNDENLVVAQMHLAFIKFHNKVADEIDREKAAAGGGKATFDEVRREVTRHFQWIVLNDYLPHVINADVLRATVADMRANPNSGSPKYFMPKSGVGPYMPVEFAAAAFRFGHSMVRSSYEWNFVHNSKTHLQVATLSELFMQTGASGNLGGKECLISEWVIDWRRFYDFSQHAGVPPPSTGPNRAKMIDTLFDFRLGDTKNFRHFPHPPAAVASHRPLPVRNLLRGFAVRLPSGQEVAAKLGLEGNLQADDIAKGSHEDILRAHDFHNSTPLWYYVLKEAETLGQGNRLGPVGSRLVAEVFVGAVMNSKLPVLHPTDPAQDWKPRFGKRAPHAFDMTDMLEFADIINPMRLS